MAKFISLVFVFLSLIHIVSAQDSVSQAFSRSDTSFPCGSSGSDGNISWNEFQSFCSNLGLSANFSQETFNKYAGRNGKMSRSEARKFYENAKSAISNSNNYQNDNSKIIAAVQQPSNQDQINKNIAQQNKKIDEALSKDSEKSFMGRFLDNLAKSPMMFWDNASNVVSSTLDAPAEGFLYAAAGSIYVGKNIGISINETITGDDHSKDRPTFSETYNNFINNPGTKAARVSADIATLAISPVGVATVAKGAKSLKTAQKLNNVVAPLGTLQTFKTSKQYINVAKTFSNPKNINKAINGATRYAAQVANDIVGYHHTISQFFSSQDK